MSSNDAIRIPYTELDEFTHGVLNRLGIPPNDAHTAVSVLSQANLRGVDTHGIDLLPAYATRIKSAF